MRSSSLWVSAGIAMCLAIATHLVPQASSAFARAEIRWHDRLSGIEHRIQSFHEQRIQPSAECAGAKAEEAARRAEQKLAEAERRLEEATTNAQRRLERLVL